MRLRRENPSRGKRSAQVLLLIFLLVLAFNFVSAQSQPRPRVALLEVQGYISTAIAEWIVQFLSTSNFYDAVIITINTFGGLGDPTLTIVDAIMSSPTPVIVFVYPSGAQALSAGTYILMAADLAVMAPYTIIGSAQPVVNGVPSEDPKLINFLVEKMRTMARVHGRNETQAARFVTHNDNLGPDAALNRGVIDLVANDVGDLLEKAHGRVVKRLGGEATLYLRGAVVERVSKDVRSEVLHFLSDPILSTLLTSLGFLILIVGLTNPGIGTELVGGILILLGLVGQGFSVNLVGLGIIILGSVLILYEIYTGGTLIALPFGIGLMVLGSILLIRSPPGVIYIAQTWLEEAMTSVILVGTFAGAFAGFIIYKVARVTRRKTLQMALEEYGRAAEDIASGSVGYVVIGGEYRKAIAVEEVKKGDEVTVVGKRNGLLLVRPGRPSKD
ncbi:MAG: nodulation protein NfeD [Thaumarchaeota archaeon]|nr:nodulation protein NfeD [Candidatus Calditenuaceae archaeon]MDW8042165.1 nodulation protein NfeD [Nitrososphaerota archaeon]